MIIRYRTSFNDVDLRVWFYKKRVSVLAYFQENGLANKEESRLDTFGYIGTRRYIIEEVKIKYSDDAVEKNRNKIAQLIKKVADKINGMKDNKASFESSVDTLAKSLNLIKDDS